MSKLFSITLNIGKETKGTFRYEEVEEAGKPPQVGTQYIKKYALPNPPPQTIKMTVESV